LSWNIKNNKYQRKNVEAPYMNGMIAIFTSKLRECMYWAIFVSKFMTIYSRFYREYTICYDLIVWRYISIVMRLKEMIINRVMIILFLVNIITLRIALK
jgi:hypothetical protein